MLTDSRTRQAGFIRNSSSRKILHQPEQQKRKSSHSSDDSFSSFQYEGNSKMSYQYKKPQPKNLYGQIGQVKSGEKKTVKPQSPHIPPKPEKKSQIKQPSFTNQRLKNNFFQQPLNQSKSKQKNLPIPKKTKLSFPRVPTPQFEQHTFKHDIQQVQNICNRIEGMKLIEGNFSFNPKTNKFKKERDFIEKESQLKNSSQNGQQISEIVPRKPKQNNYFNEAQNHKFQYDFESSSQSGNDEQAQQHEQSFGNQSQQEDHDQAINYYQQQQKRKTQQPQITKTVSKNNFPQNYQQNYPYQSQKNPKKVQNEQSEDNNQELITEYNKTDFGLKLTQQMRRDAALKNQQNKQMQEQQQGVIQKHGGICFEVDVKQFNQGTGNNLSYQSTKKSYSQAKKKKVNEKEQLLKRRQMAKIYSKQARFRLFGFA